MIRHSGNREPLIFFHLKLVAKIALSVGAVACAGLLVVLLLITDDKGSSYGQIISAYSLARQQLEPAMLVFGLTAIVFAGITTWLIALYSSFRIAGPLFRFSRNLEMEIKRGSAAPVPIRSTDQLQCEWREFDASVTALRGHYAALREALDDVRQSLQDGADPPAGMRQAVDRLKEVEHRARL